MGTAAVWVLLELRQGTTRRPGTVKATRASEVLFRLIVGVGAFVAGALANVARSATIRPAAIADWIGLVLFWSGIALRLWSFHTLGQYFTFTVQTSRDQPVITDGPYRADPAPQLYRVAPRRHGGGPVHRKLVVVRVPHAHHDGRLVFRIRVEEQALLQHLGDGYRDYAATHKRLVPFSGDGGRTPVGATGRSCDSVARVQRCAQHLDGETDLLLGAVTG